MAVQDRILSGGYASSSTGKCSCFPKLRPEFRHSWLPSISSLSREGRSSCRHPGTQGPLRHQLDRRLDVRSSAVIPLPALQNVQTSIGAAGLWAAIVSCATVLTISTVVVTCLVCLRPLLKTLQRTVAAFEHTARECEKAARGVERATLVFQLDVPHALGAIERAGGEISTLGHTFNFLSGGNKKKSKKSKSKTDRNRNDSVPRPGQESKMELFGRDGMQRVVQDISSITLALSPSMQLWRKRLGDITSSFERASTKQPPEDEAAAQDLLLPSNGQEADKQDANWVDEWHKLSTGASDVADRLSKGHTPSAEMQAGMVDSVKSFASKAADEARKSQSYDSMDDSDDDEDADTSSSGTGRLVDQAGEAADVAADGATETASRIVAEESGMPQPEAGQQKVALSSHDEELLQQLLARSDVARIVLDALNRAQSAAAAAAAASDELQDVLGKVRSGELGQEGGPK